MRAEEDYPVNEQHQVAAHTALKITIPRMTNSNPYSMETRGLRRSSRRRSGSGSEYSPQSVASEHPPLPEEEEEEEEEQVYTRTSKRGRTVKLKKNTYAESESEDGDAGGLFDNDDDVEIAPVKRLSRTRSSRSDRNLDGFVEAEEEEELEPDGDYGRPTRYGLRNREKKVAPRVQVVGPSRTQPNSAQTRGERLAKRKAKEEQDIYIDNQSSPDADASYEDGPHDDAVEEDYDLALDADGDADVDEEAEEDSNDKGYSLRARRQVNYAIPPPLEEMTKPPPKAAKAKSNARRGKGPGWNMTGQELGRWMGLDNDSVSNTFQRL
jgi:ATPase family AAA domain-containing protein 2